MAQADRRLTIAGRVSAVVVFTTVALTSACRPATTSGLRTSEDRPAPFTVVHKPPTGPPLARPPFRYMHYYRTEVRNVSDHPLKIVWFEAYHGTPGGPWQAGNVLGRALRGDDFSAWYTEGDAIVHGVIPAGGTAVCDVNWYGSYALGRVPLKWAFIAVDAAANDYYVEAVVEPSVVKAIDHGALWLTDPNSPRRVLGGEQ